MNNQHLTQLPLSFYDQSPNLAKIRQAAFSRVTSPDAVLACVLTRVAATIPPGIVLPERTSLNFISALIGESGTGKSVAFNAARDLLPEIGTQVDGWSIGSGEGIAEIYLGKPDADGIRPMQHTSAHFYVDEGEQLLKVAGREGSTTFATIRSAWSGSSIGTANANADRRRHLKWGSYRFTLCVGMQPKFASELLTGVHAGDPQRFMFAGVTHPSQPDVLPRFPEVLNIAIDLPSDIETVLTVDPEVQRIITSHRVRKQRREVIDDPLDSHRQLLQLKVAVLLSYLSGNGDVTVEWWNAARQVVDVSCQIRNELRERASLESKSRQMEKVQDRILTNEAIDMNRVNRYLESMVVSIGRRAFRAGSPVNRAVFSQACAGKHRNEVSIDDALALALHRGHIQSAVGKSGLYEVGKNPIGTRN